MRWSAGHRAGFAAILFLLCFAAIAVKLVDLQVVNPTRYRDFSADHRWVAQTLSADRGTVFDRSGVELAVSIPQWSVFVDPALIEDPVAESQQVADIIGADAAAIEERMRGEGRFAYLVRQAPETVAEGIRGLGLAGVGLLEEPKRFLPNGDLGRSIIGMTDIDGNGLSGIEAQYGDLLTGTPGSLSMEQGTGGRTIPMGDRVVTPASPGHNLVLAIDRSLQFEAERLLAEQVAATYASGGVAIVTNPTTGEILAMANVARDPESGTVRVDANNAALTTSYEPGSVMKMVTASAAIDEGLVDYASEFVIEDQLRLGDWDFTEHTPHGTVTWPLPRILSNSSNVGTIKIAQLLGAQRLHNYITRFGLGTSTAVRFPNEQAGFVTDPDSWNASDIGSIPIGQAIAVTPMQMLQSFNVIANGGVYMPPRLVLETVAPDGTRSLNIPGEPVQVVSENTADMMNMMLRGVVAVGTGKKAAVDGYTVAGKTGTARKPLARGGYGDAYQATFVGFAPAEAPAVSILVMIDEPGNGNIYGGSAAAPVFAKLAAVALRVLNVPPPSRDRAARYGEALPIEARELFAATDPITGAIDTSAVITNNGRVRAAAVSAPRVVETSPVPEPPPPTPERRE
jgi:cell division protein FtsI (penicillin-binding protein 3)